MDLHEKTKHYDLMACANAECCVSTFIKQLECPVCESPGTLLREPYDGRGAPGWVGRVADD